jgi:hypothetical protein
VGEGNAGRTLRVGAAGEIVAEEEEKSEQPAHSFRLSTKRWFEVLTKCTLTTAKNETFILAVT